MGVILKLILVTVVLPCVLGQAQDECFGAGSVAGAAIGAFVAAFILIGAAYYFRKWYWKSRKGRLLLLFLSVFVRNVSLVDLSTHNFFIKFKGSTFFLFHIIPHITVVYWVAGLNVAVGLVTRASKLKYKINHSPEWKSNPQLSRLQPHTATMPRQPRNAFL